MAGTLVITTLSDGTNSTSATNCIQGSAKAWVNFDGSNGTRNGSYNVSSVTRVSTGQYTVTMTNALPNINYAVNVSASPNAAGTINAGIFIIFTSGGGTLVAPTTTVFQFSTYSPGAALMDPNYVCVSVFSS